MKEHLIELTNIIYDTLMNNTQFPQFKIDDTGDCCCNAKQGIMEIEYLGHKYVINVEEEQAC